MIRNIDDQVQEGSVTEAGAHRVFAVVAREKARAAEMARRFAAEGDEVETVWYRDAKQLQAQAGERKSSFEVVILFTDPKAKASADAEAEAEVLRRWLNGTPLIEAA